ncbi:response regulator [Algihabitans albus]|uniref:response regulator n=1 Tax=Algihabitans albus TaxID=2164067 RepID=UPI000E5D9D73|nr:response regulator [Algihabitans albus]
MNKIVFVVDDVETDRELVADNLIKSGFSVVKFSNGEEAVRAVETVKPVAVVSDIFMPKLGGLEMIRLLRRKGYCGLIVAMSSGGNFNGFDAIKYAIVLGADLGIRKPINIKKIGALISVEIERASFKNGINNLDFLNTPQFAKEFSRLAINSKDIARRYWSSFVRTNLITSHRAICQAKN